MGGPEPHGARSSGFAPSECRVTVIDFTKMGLAVDASLGRTRGLCAPCHRAGCCGSRPCLRRPLYEPYGFPLAYSHILSADVFFAFRLFGYL